MQIKVQDRERLVVILVTNREKFEIKAFQTEVVKVIFFPIKFYGKIYFHGKFVTEFYYFIYCSYYCYYYY